MSLRRALGLRGRIVGAVLVTTVATLAVAALALLGPLENKLRAADFKTFQSAVPRAATAPFASIQYLDDISSLKTSIPPVTSSTNKQERISIHAARVVQQNGQKALNELEFQASSLADRAAASEVAVYGYSDATGHGYQLVKRSPSDVDIAAGIDPNDVTRAFLHPSGKPVYSTTTIDGTEYARAALAFRTKDQTTQQSNTWVLAVASKPFAEVNDAAHAVRTAFIDAVLAGLALTLLLAIPLSFRIVRRLRRLREAAVELAEGGPHVNFRADRARDEVGDLARTFELMQTQLEQQEEARRAFVATASHELRTPLTSLEGMLELLEDDLDPSHPDLDEARALLTRARAQSHRLGRLAADLLDLSRIDAQVELRSEPVELGELSRAVLAEFELGTVERAIRCELQDGGAPVWALGDPGSVARILRILLDNALRASPRGSRVVVELRSREQAVLSVCDEGPGVHASDRDLIFQRFQRGRDTSGQAGFGLGLAIGRELALRMGGELALEDTGCPGARFTLKLPVTTAPEHDPLVVA